MMDDGSSIGVDIEHRILCRGSVMGKREIIFTLEAEPACSTAPKARSPLSPAFGPVLQYLGCDTTLLQMTNFDEFYYFT